MNKYISDNFHEKFFFRNQKRNCTNMFKAFTFLDHYIINFFLFQCFNAESLVINKT